MRLSSVVFDGRIATIVKRADSEKRRVMNVRGVSWLFVHSKDEAIFPARKLHGFKHARSASIGKTKSK
jgi:hypothetical protein